MYIMPYLLYTDINYTIYTFLITIVILPACDIYSSIFHNSINTFLLSEQYLLYVIYFMYAMDEIIFCK